MARLERWVARTIGERSDPDEQRLLHRYVVWHLLRRLRTRNGDKVTTRTQTSVTQNHWSATWPAPSGMRIGAAAGAFGPVLRILVPLGG
jgi:hypothetical protein